MKFTLDNLLTLLRGDDGKKSPKYIDLVPNARDFKIVMQGENILFQNENIKKTIKSHISIIKHKNKPMNRYIKHQIIRLQRYLFEGKTYWKLIGLLNTRSIAWYIVHLNKVLPKWSRELPWWAVLKLRKQTIKISQNHKGQIKLFRVYIEKPSGGWRPLGVPTLEWRIYLSMLNTALIIWLERVWNKEQHGYFPERGTMTAWKSILEKIGRPTIYEFDLKQFFPNVEIQYITRKLQSTGMPKHWYEYFENLNKSKPQLQQVDKVDETDIREAQDLERGVINRNQQWYQPVQEYINANGIEHWEMLVRGDTGGCSIHHEYEFVKLQAAILSSIQPVQFHSVTKGLPQGGGISPTLSVQALDELFRLNPTAVMYADDGIIFDEPNLTSNTLKISGITIHPEKSGYVKRNGVWEKQLKFCGMKYDGNTDQLWSETRKGKSISISKAKIESIMKAGNHGHKDRYAERGNVWESLYNSRVSGFIQAVHYNGTFELSQYWDRWEINKSPTSFAMKKLPRLTKKYGVKATLYNTSTYACQWLANKLRKKYKGVPIK